MALALVRVYYGALFKDTFTDLKTVKYNIGSFRFILLDDSQYFLRL